MTNSNRLFYGSCFALITTAFSFSIRAGILPQLAETFSLSGQQLGFINSMWFLGFPISMILGGLVAVHWYVNDVITPYKSIGIIALSLLGMSLILFVLAFLADMLNRIRNNQEKILYLTKKNHFEEN